MSRSVEISKTATYCNQVKYEIFSSFKIIEHFFLLINLKIMFWYLE